ncbi:MAG TPA: 16S rRNA (cytidine(1402)-2'-O)-methyltransferase [Alphaproteobacteria bacterium]|nr:16S rRNA (cytidine(1402)-2'-O)-methyltransferase [Alphaproteobacteria bacterium]HNS43648.1 16S rRNA (cytidine(1402)-2'-O)-methyltransferase [Alphaproteobacteria bacterium]
MEHPDPTQNDSLGKDPFGDVIKPIPQKLPSGLYLVATPIGNLRDITLRALDVLSSVDLVACEDTRMTGKLFSLLGIKQKLIPYHDHNADTQRPHLIKKIDEGMSVALVSDAGMPLISDPGYKLVRDCAEKNLYVTSLPGANAPLMALQLSGLPSDHFAFLGFLPNKTKARQDALRTWKDTPATLVIFESATRVASCCKDIIATLGDRPMALTRELTKKFEEVWRGQVSDIIARLETEGAPKGEIVLVIGGAEEGAGEDIDLDALLIKALKTLSVKEAVAAIVDQTGLPKKQVYNRALEIKDELKE